MSSLVPKQYVESSCQRRKDQDRDRRNRRQPARRELPAPAPRLSCWYNGGARRSPAQGGPVVSRSLSRWQAVLLGFVVLLGLGLGGVGLFLVGSRTWFAGDSFHVRTGFKGIQG